MTTTTTLAPSVGRRVWRPGLVAAGTAALANLALFAASRAAGVSYSCGSPQTPTRHG